MPLYALGWVHLALTVVAVAAGTWLLQRARRAGWRRAPTWACGFVAPTPRMQYTAGSFAGILTGWFAFILRPERRAQLPVEPFPATASLVEHTPETVLRYLVEPVSAVALRVAAAARALQRGGVQSYLLYLHRRAGLRRSVRRPSMSRRIAPGTATSSTWSSVGCT
jgi:hydrogenase-4 component B